MPAYYYFDKYKLIELHSDGFAFNKQIIKRMKVNSIISDDFIEDTIDATAARKNPALTSMLLDFKAGRKMELEAILGNALKFAAEKNVDLPLMQDHYRSLSNY